MYHHGVVVAVVVTGDDVEVVGTIPEFVIVCTCEFDKVYFSVVAERFFGVNVFE